MKSNMICAVLLFALCATASAQPNGAPARMSAVFIARVGRYQLQSNAWVILHQRLMYEAHFGAEAVVAGLDADEQAKWKRAVESYRTFLAQRSPIVDRELIQMNATLARTTTFTVASSIPKAAADVLNEAMPLYRKAQWEIDDRANRFWIAIAEPMLASAGEELVEANSKAYGAPWPKDILVDICSYGWEFGAYTTDDAHSVIANIPGNHGFAALEALFHEPAHAIVDGRNGAIGSDINKVARELGIRVPFNLWHAILFYTASETTRRALAERGVTDYKPVMLAMYDRGFADYRKSLEAHWQAFLDGRISRQEAIRNIVKELGKPKT